jgi:hypothetical protein
MLFEFTVAERNLCGRCLAESAAYGHARAATIYDYASRGVLLRFKHGDGLHLTGLLMPVPLHWTRLFVGRCGKGQYLDPHSDTLTLASSPAGPCFADKLESLTVGRKAPERLSSG